MKKTDFYSSLNNALRALTGEERDWLANMANTAALLYGELPEINWAGFYLLKEGELVLGPFQGKPACIRISLGRGVCGETALLKEAHVVPDVHEFPGHIACDPASKSEIVLPIIVGEQLVGVLDIDSPIIGRFDDEDQSGLAQIVTTLVNSCDWGI